MGIVGQFWVSAVFTAQLLLFAVLASEFRTKAPGAKTFLQVEYYTSFCSLFRKSERTKIESHAATEIP